MYVIYVYMESKTKKCVMFDKTITTIAFLSNVQFYQMSQLEVKN